MYRRYLQAIDLIPPVQSVSEVSTEDSKDSVSSNLKEDSSDVRYTEVNFPEPHTIVGEAHLKAARSVSSVSSPISAGDNNLCPTAFTFDPGGIRKKGNVVKPLIIQDLLDQNAVPEFRRPPKISLIERNELLIKQQDDIEFVEPETSTRDFQSIGKKKSPLRIIVPENLRNKDELILVKPIKENLNSNFILPNPKSLSPRFPKVSRNEIIRVLPAITPLVNNQSTRNKNLVNSEYDSLNTSIKTFSDKVPSEYFDVSTPPRSFNTFHKVLPIDTTPSKRPKSIHLMMSPSSFRKIGSRQWNLNPICCGLSSRR